jgi:hypothetical protein
MSLRQPLEAAARLEAASRKGHIHPAEPATTTDSPTQPILMIVYG